MPDPVELFYKEQKSTSQNAQPPLVILHGMFGSSSSWNTMARQLAEYFNVVTVDLRNHGRSPHTSSMTFAEMAQDVVLLMEKLELVEPILLGHSMGGKVAMTMKTAWQAKP